VTKCPARGLRATGVVYAERAAVASGGLLDDFAGRWISAHTAACVSHRRGEMSAQLFDRKMACLRQRRAELAATAEVLAQTTRDSAAQAVDAARGLPPVTLCDDDERLLAAADPATAAAVESLRERLARVRALERGGRHVEGTTAIAPLLATATELAYAPVQAEVQLLAGKLWMHQMQVAEDICSTRRSSATRTCASERATRSAGTRAASRARPPSTTGRAAPRVAADVAGSRAWCRHAAAITTPNARPAAPASSG
jgi:hypothetical protein